MDHFEISHYRKNEKPTRPKFNSFAEFFSQDLLKSQDILTQEQIKHLDVHFLNPGTSIDDIGFGVLIAMAIGMDFDTLKSNNFDTSKLESMLTEEQKQSAERLFEKVENSYQTGTKLPDELLEGGAFSITTKEKKAKLKKNILIGVGATALIGGLIYLVRKK